MKGLILLVILLFASVAMADVEEFQGIEYEFVSGEWYWISDNGPVHMYHDDLGVLFNTGSTEQERHDLLDLYSCTPFDTTMAGWVLVRFPHKIFAVQIINLLDDSPLVDRLSPCSLPIEHTPDDTYYRQTGYEAFTGEDENPDKGSWFLDWYDTHVATQPVWGDSLGIHAEEAWSSYTRVTEVVVAVYDHGLWVNHPDIHDNLWENPGEAVAPNDGIDSDGNGWVDDLHGVNTDDDIEVEVDPYGSGNSLNRDNGEYYFRFDDNSGYYPQGSNHGNLVASPIAAVTDNDFGIAGIGGTEDGQPGVKLMVLTGGRQSGSNNNQNQAIEYAVQMGAKILSTSIGMTVSAYADMDSLYESGELLSFHAIGNHARYGTWPEGPLLDGIVVVGMTTPYFTNRPLAQYQTVYPQPNNDGNDWFYEPDSSERYWEIRSIYYDPTVPEPHDWLASNFGRDLTLMAPGSRILHFIDPQNSPPPVILPGNCSWGGGTSVASPLAAAVAGMILSNYPNLTVSELKAILCESAERLPGRANFMMPQYDVNEQVPEVPNWEWPDDWVAPANNPYDPTHETALCPGWYDYDDTYMHGNTHGSWDIQMGYGRINAARALEYAANLNWLGPLTVPPINLAWEECEPPMQGIRLTWDAPTPTMDIRGYFVRRVLTEHTYPRPTITEDEFGPISGTNWSDYSYEPDDNPLLTVQYYVYAVDYSGWSGPETGPVGFGGQEVGGPGTSGELSDVMQILPEEYAMKVVSPNPFNAYTTLRYETPRAGDVKISIFNTLGQAVLEVTSDYHPAGYHQRGIDASSWTSGVYFIHMETETFQATQKMVLIN